MRNKVTVVTVTYNAESCLEETILSVLSQNYQFIEYIVIDGGSDDKTIDIISNYAGKISYWESKPDNGIYDAMNRSIKIATGEWICFMNAGDKFYDVNVLSSVFRNNNFSSYDIVYGNHSIIDGTNLVVKVPNALNTIWKRIPMCHQSIFVRTSTAVKYPFELNYKFAADYNFIYQQYLLTPDNFIYLDKIISIISTGGYSETNSVATYKEYRLISLALKYSTFKKIYFSLVIFERVVIIIIKSLIMKFKMLYN